MFMKLTNLVGTAALLLLFGMAAPSYAQDHPQDQPAKPEEKPAKPDESKTPHDSARPQTEAPKEQPHPDAKDTARPKDEPAKVDQSKSARGGAGRIPDDKFKAHFGREHTFHVGHPQIVGGQPHFQYGGFSFVISQPWPSGWGYNDEVYIVDIDGTYYLLDLAHPGAQLALVVVI
jgi:hypothetical protein